jgi:ketosteroid isomerase-like protein
MTRAVTRGSMFAVTFGILFGLSPVRAQQTTLQHKSPPIERSLAPKDTAHEYAVTIQGNQAFTVAVDQHGIDVVVTVLGPDGTQLIQVDRAFQESGTAGTEVARVAALTAGEYHIRVAPFERPDAKPGKYTIALSELRSLTAEERGNAESERQIAAIEQEWEAAIDKLDVPTLTRILRNDGFGLGPVPAAMRTREQIIEGWQNEAKERTKLTLTQQHTISEHSIKAAGDTAVSSGRFLITTTIPTHGSGRFSGQFVHVWAKNDEGWKLVGDYTFPFGRVPREKKSPTSVDPRALSAYAGTYRYEVGFGTVKMTVDNGVLNAQFSNPFDSSGPSPKLPLTPLTETTFVGSGTDEFTFVRSLSGDVREFIVVSDGPASRAIKEK